MLDSKTSASPSKKGYPGVELVRRGCLKISLIQPRPIYLTVTAKLHNLSQHKTAAILQVFRIVTLAAHWLLRDIRQRNPIDTFAKYRKHVSAQKVRVALVKRGGQGVVRGSILDVVGTVCSE